MEQPHRPKRAARIWHTWQSLGIRRDVGVIMLIMGLGRLGLYRTTSSANFLSLEVYGILLVGMGLLVIISKPWRTKLWARIIAILGAALLFGMAADVGVISVTMLLEAWLGYLLAEEGLL
jgi:hypothetical protein